MYHPQVDRKVRLIVVFALGLAAMSWTSVHQNNVIRQQRALIVEQQAHPQCFVEAPASIVPKKGKPWKQTKKQSKYKYRAIMELLSNPAQKTL